MWARPPQWSPMPGDDAPPSARDDAWRMALATPDLDPLDDSHAMISDALYESVVEACPTQISMIPDCMVTTTLPECGVVSPNFNSDR